MSTQELVTLQEALVWVYGPIILVLAMPVLLALGITAAVLGGATVVFQSRSRRAGAPPK